MRFELEKMLAAFIATCLTVPGTIVVMVVVVCLLLFVGLVASLTTPLFVWNKLYRAFL